MDYWLVDYLVCYWAGLMVCQMAAHLVVTMAVLTVDS